MEKIWKYRLPRRVWIYSMAYLLLLGVLAVGLYYLYEGEYLSAWFTSSIVALLLLIALSVPRKLRLNRERLRIDCLLDIVELPLSEIASVRRVERSEQRTLIPLLGAWGFFGYYGNYLDVVQVERVKIYASEWNNLVEITDIYEDRLFVSCSEPDRFVEELQRLLQEQE